MYEFGIILRIIYESMLFILQKESKYIINQDNYRVAFTKILKQFKSVLLIETISVRYM